MCVPSAQSCLAFRAGGQRDFSGGLSRLSWCFSSWYLVWGRKGKEADQTAAWKSNSWLGLVSRDMQVSGRRQTELPSLPSGVFFPLFVHVHLSPRWALHLFNLLFCRLGAVCLWLMALQLPSARAGINRKSTCWAFHSIREHIVPLLASCLAAIPPSSLELICAGSDKGANHRLCPHIKAFCTSRKHCLSPSSCLASTAWRISFGMEQIIVISSHLICPVSRSEHSWPELWLGWLGALCTLRGLKVFWNKKLFKNLMENTEKAGHGLLS